MFGFLLRDVWVRLVLLVWLAVAALYVLPLFSPDARRFFEEVLVPSGMFYLDDAGFAGARQRLTPEGMRRQLARNESMLAQPGPAAQRVIERARTASGGAAWNAVRGLHEVGADDALGQHVGHRPVAELPARSGHLDGRRRRRGR